MLLASDVYQIILDMARKDLRGRGFSPEEYNNTARIVNEMVFGKYFSEFESNPENSEAMSSFKIVDLGVPVVAGVAALPTRFYHLVGMPRYTDGSGAVRYIDVVSSMEYARRQRDYLTQATLTHPICRFGTVNETADMSLFVSPSTITSITIDYLRTPDIPFLDYYINDSTLQYTWMDSGGGIVSVPIGCTARDGTIGAADVISETVDWEWDEEDLPMIINLFLQLMGIQLPSSELYEGGTLQEQKLENK